MLLKIITNTWKQIRYLWLLAHIFRLTATSYFFQKHSHYCWWNWLHWLVGQDKYTREILVDRNIDDLLPLPDFRRGLPEVKPQHLRSELDNNPLRHSTLFLLGLLGDTAVRQSLVPRSNRNSSFLNTEPQANISLTND